MTGSLDLGCPGVNVAAWKAANRAPLFRGKINRWILVRTLRDKPDTAELRTTLAAVFVRWFSGTPFDPILIFNETTRSGPADLIRLVNASQDRLTFGATVRRREDLDYLPIPTLIAGPVVYMEVAFAYRGFGIDIAWPTHKSATIGVLKTQAECPVTADWMLDRVGAAVENAPAELSTFEKGKAVVESIVAPYVFWAAAVAAGGAIIWLKGRK